MSVLIVGLFFISTLASRLLWSCGVVFIRVASRHAATAFISHLDSPMNAYSSYASRVPVAVAIARPVPTAETVTNVATNVLS